MLFERPSEVSSFNGDMLPGIPAETDKRAGLLRYSQKLVPTAVR